MAKLVNKEVQSNVVESGMNNVTVTGLIIQFDLSNSFRKGSSKLLNEVRSVLDSMNDKMRMFSDELKGVQILNADSVSHNNLIILDDKKDEDTDEDVEDWDENGDDSEWDDEDTDEEDEDDEDEWDDEDLDEDESSEDD